MSSLEDKSLNWVNGLYRGMNNNFGDFRLEISKITRPDGTVIVNQVDSDSGLRLVSLSQLQNVLNAYQNQQLYVFFRDPTTEYTYAAQKALLYEGLDMLEANI